MKKDDIEERALKYFYDPNNYPDPTGDLFFDVSYKLIRNSFAAGKYRFAEVVEFAKVELGSIEGLLPALKRAYGATYLDAPLNILETMDDPKTVGDYKLVASNE